ncbi:hypothetical protein HMPREF1316_2634 [Olsenella profusa F0195]|uniref:Uncharacterized protein n=1 Tax=Olsenella profusa F0195 TaxID=1125712 RepID=U2TT93_9ACTN|nr:hypothetical protein HMPREF1316_2634 [Olsenella profusa F0195]
MSATNTDSNRKALFDDVPDRDNRLRGSQVDLAPGTHASGIE